MYMYEYVTTNPAVMYNSNVSIKNVEKNKNQFFSKEN